MAFEQLMAEAAVKKSKDEKKAEKEKGKEKAKDKAQKATNS